ncbi:MAG: hypothetical protein M1829_001567 [Trizodia sp. TS-e1964]|nr:MAG: hypothetical protein M1829_001567 [Trizodia sp. TS-e1964]
MLLDEHLAVLLRSLQRFRSSHETVGAIRAIPPLLSQLSNPQNITLLTSQILTSPAIWNAPSGLRTCDAVLDTFQKASGLISRGLDVIPPLGGSRAGAPLPRNEWARAVIKGADERAPRWKHLLVISGVLLGFASVGIPPDRLDSDLAAALVRASNLVLDAHKGTNGIEMQCLTLVLNHSYRTLASGSLEGLNHDLLLPLLTDSAFLSNEGFQSGYFLGTINSDILLENEKYTWPQKSSSYIQIKRLRSNPLVSSMGPLARLISHSIREVRDPYLVVETVENILLFSKILSSQWRQIKISEIAITEESKFLDGETLEVSLPTLWQVLKISMFTSVAVLASVMERILNDGTLSSEMHAPILASKILNVNRNLYFISSRLGSNSLSQNTFVFLASIDILAAYPGLAEEFLHEIRPINLGSIPSHALDRSFDSFFLNVAELLAIVMSPETNEMLVAASAIPYLLADQISNSLPIFESAHSAMLSVLAAPQNADLTVKSLPVYIGSLFKAFPQALSFRQIRFAFRSLLAICSPPSLISLSYPDLPLIIMEMIYDRALHGSTSPQPMPTGFKSEDEKDMKESRISEQALFILTLLEMLPCLPLDALEEWLALAARLISSVSDTNMADTCKQKFWQAISSGDMDIQRAEISAVWWSTKGGKEILLGNRPNGQTD